MNNPETSNTNISFQRNVTIIWNRQPPAPRLDVVIASPLHGKFLRPFPPIGPSQVNLIAHMIHCLYEKVEDTKGVMAKRKMRKGQTMSYKTLHRKLKNEQHEHHISWIAAVFLVINNKQTIICMVDVFVCWWYRFCLFLRFFYWILELFMAIVVFSSSFYYVILKTGVGLVLVIWQFFHISY